MSEEKKSDNPGKKFWPHSSMFAIVITASFAVFLFILCVLLKTKLGWPPDESTGTFLIVIAVISLIPILLSVLDVIKAHGGTIGYKDLKIDFSKVTYSAPSAIVIPSNIGGYGVPVNETSIMMILDALKKAGESNIAIVDIEDGKAWWETRLLLLVEGATRLGKPDKIVFTGKVLHQEQYFLGWAKPSELLPPLLSSNPLYNQLYYVAKVSALQWALVKPTMSDKLPEPHAFMVSATGSMSANLAFDKNGLPNEFLTEQILGTELGNQVEQGNVNLFITQGKLIDLFGGLLVQDQIDENWVAEQQLKTFFEHETEYVALTQNGKYLKLVPRLSILNEILKNNMGINNQIKKSIS